MQTSYLSTVFPIEIIFKKGMFEIDCIRGVKYMSLISIVAREDFISMVMNIGKPQIMGETVGFKVIIPDTALIAFSGDEEFSKITALAADTLVKQGFNLKEIAESIQSSYSSGTLNYEHCGRHFEAVLAGYSQAGEAQYHIISNSNPLESFYPAQAESLYYANGTEPMLLLEKMLKMHGMGTITQAQEAQIHFIQEAVKLFPDAYNHATKLVLKKAH